MSGKDQRRLRSDAQRATGARFRQRCKIIWNLVQGRTPKGIAEFLQCSQSQVFRIARQFVKEGLAGLADRREDNGEAKITEEYEGWLLGMAAGSPRDYGFDRPTWTQQLFICALLAKTGIQISPTRMSRLLRRLRIRLGSPKPIVGCPWKKGRRTRRLNPLRRLIHSLPPDEVVLYGDEVEIPLNPKIGLDWLPCGMQKTVLTPGKNEKLYLAGALNARTGRLTWVQYDRKTSDRFILPLWQLVKTDYPRAKRIHLILDNYRIHKSKRTQLALSSVGDRIQLHFLPPYCPDEKKIERVWRDLHANVTRNHQCRNMKELLKEVHTYFRKRDQQLQKTYRQRTAA